MSDSDMLQTVVRLSYRRKINYSSQLYGVATSIFLETSSGLPPNTTFLIERVIKKARKLLELGDDWDSYGASVITDEAVRQAISILQDPSFSQLLPFTNPHVAVFPLHSGGVQLDLNAGKYPLEIEISPDGIPEYTFFGVTNEVIAEENTLDSAIEWYTTFASN